MSRILSAAFVASAFAARYPNPGGELASLHASGDSTVDSVQAAAVRGFNAASGKLQWLKATDHFYVKGQTVLAGDFVQVQETDAKRLVAAGRAELASDEEAAEASKAPAAKK